MVILIEVPDGDETEPQEDETGDDVDNNEEDDEEEAEEEIRESPVQYESRVDYK